MEKFLFVKTDQWYKLSPEIIQKVVCEESGLRIVFSRKIDVQIPGVRTKCGQQYILICIPKKFDDNGCDLRYECSGNSRLNLFHISSRKQFAGVLFDADLPSCEYREYPIDICEKHSFTPRGIGSNYYSTAKYSSYCKK